MKIFVTGATGKVGSRFVPYLLKQGHEVRILVRNPERVLTLKEQGVEVVEGDLLDNDNLTEAIRGVDAVVHIAAQFRGGISEEVARAVNIDGTINLAKAALKAGVTRFVFTSTAHVYDDTELSRPSTEDDILTATALYPKTKMLAEEELLKLREQGLDIRIMRLTFVYGAGDPHIEEVLPYMSKWNPSWKMSIVHHEDVSQALLLAASTPDVSGSIYNVADEASITVGELFKLQGEPEPALPNEGWVRLNPWGMLVDTTRIKNELKYSPKYPSIYIAKDMNAL